MYTTIQQIKTRYIVCPAQEYICSMGKLDNKLGAKTDRKKSQSCFLLEIQCHGNLTFGDRQYTMGRDSEK